MKGYISVISNGPRLGRIYIYIYIPCRDLKKCWPSFVSRLLSGLVQGCMYSTVLGLVRWLDHELTFQTWSSFPLQLTTSSSPQNRAFQVQQRSSICDINLLLAVYSTSSSTPFPSTKSRCNVSSAANLSPWSEIWQIPTPPPARCLRRTALLLQQWL